MATNSQHTADRFWLNGKEELLDSPLSIRDLCDRLGLGPKGFAVERNGEIVSRSAHPSTMVHVGDHIEIVHMVGGG